MNVEDIRQGLAKIQQRLYGLRSQKAAIGDQESDLADELGELSSMLTVMCSVKEEIVNPFTDVLTFDFGADQSKGQVSDSDIAGFMSINPSFSNGEENLYISGGEMVQCLIPASNGSTRAEFGGNIMPDAPRYKVEQTVNFRAPFDYGGPVNQTTKLGFGLGSSNYVSGGSPAGNPDTTGFSIRVIQRGGFWKGYSYSCDRFNGQGGFGEDWNNGAQVAVTPGTPQVVTMEVLMNTGSNTDGRFIMTVDGVVVDDRAVKWMESGHNIQDARFQSFFGGSDSTWSPGSTQEIGYTDVKYSSAQS